MFRGLGRHRSLMTFSQSDVPIQRLHNLEACLILLVPKARGSIPPTETLLGGGLGFEEARHVDQPHSNPKPATQGHHKQARSSRGSPFFGTNAQRRSPQD